MLNNKGGKARHPFMVNSGQDRYILIMTGVVLPPLKGDVRVVLEGEPAMDYTLYNSEPIVDLGFHRRPVFEENIMKGLQARDTLALWVDMKPLSDERLFSDNSISDLVGKSSADGPNGHLPLSLNFYATETGDRVLNIPVLYADLMPTGGSNGAHH
jgi:hypothetical protein